MPPAACSRQNSKDLTWVGVFARSARLSAWSASVIVSIGNHLLFAFFSVKPFFSLDLLTFEVCHLGNLLTNIGTNVSPCKTPAIMLKSVSPSGE